MEQKRTMTVIREIKAEESINELARLLGSDVITDAVIKNAQEMKDLAVKTKKI
jgi:DNA repair protein RecN (Recombination protein N)